MESSFSWTCLFKSHTSNTFYMTKHMPKPSSGANRVSVGHSSLVTMNGEHFYGENFIHDFPKLWKHIKEETNSSSTTLHMDTCSWKLTGEANSTTPHVDILWLTDKVMKHTLLDTTPQKLIGVVMTLTPTMRMSPCSLKWIGEHITQMHMTQNNSLASQFSPFSPS